jgi:hypothetical protein
MADNDPNRISQQILTTADTYDPGVYHERLRTADSFERTIELSDQFVPYTTAGGPDAKLKLFVVGLIPPSAQVTGRVLDRSASIASQLSNQGIADAQQEAVSNATIGAPVGPKSTNDADFWKQYVCMCNRMGVQADQLARVLQAESNFNPSSANIQKGVTIAKGLNQLIHSTATGYGTKPPNKGIGMTEEEWDDYLNTSRESQLKWVERYFGNRARGKTAADLYVANFGNNHNANGSLYDSSIPAQKDSYDKNRQLDRDNKGYITADDLAASMRPLNPQFLAAINNAKQALGMSLDAPPDLSIKGDAPTKNFVGKGDKAMTAAQRQISQNSKTDLNSTGLGIRFAEAQRRMAAEVQSAIDDMANTPPLRLLVNPQSFKVSNEKVISDGNWTRTGPIVEHWGDSQDKIDGSGKLAAFYAADIGGFEGTGSQVTLSGGPGLTRTARQFSASYQNFLSLYQLYRNNAGIFSADTTDGGARTNLVYSGSIYIYFDHTLYIGSFDSFTVTETDTAPFTLEYSFSFTVRATFLLDESPDPRFTYGITSMNVNAPDANSPVLPSSEPETTVPYRSMADIAADNADPVLDKKIAGLFSGTKVANPGTAKIPPAGPGSLGLPVFDENGNKIGEI